MENAEPLGLTEPLFKFNRKYVYVQSPNTIMDMDTFIKIPPGAFKEHFKSAATYQERSIKPDGTVSYKPVSAAAAWIKWPLRNEVTKLTYAPGQKKQTDASFNIWTGWGAEPEKGDVTPFLKLVDHLFTGAEPAAKEWFLSWCAYPLQNPGVKMFSSSVFHGISLS